MGINQSRVRNSSSSVSSISSQIATPTKRGSIGHHSMQRISSYIEDETKSKFKEIETLVDLKKGGFNSLINAYSNLSVPTVFRWNGKGIEVYISGSFNNWEENIMKKSESSFYTIVNCMPGHHSFKFLVDGIWLHDETQPTENNAFGTLNNCIDIDENDLNIDLALSFDEKHSNKSSDRNYNENPQTDYGQEIPQRPILITGMTLNKFQPSSLPPYLNETVLNVEVAQHHDPNLLTTPYHVQINHLYASSISSGIASLSVTVRYRTKYITTLFYKSITE